MVYYHLTTVDNPYDPFTDYDNWNRFDTEHGHYSNSMLARIANFTEDMTDEEEQTEVKRAIDQIIKYDPFNKFTFKTLVENPRDSEYKTVIIPDEELIDYTPRGV